MRIIPLALLIYATFLPMEMRMVIAGQNLFAPRIAGFLLLPVLLRQLLIRPPQWQGFDLILVAGVGWMMLSFGVAYGLTDAFLRGGALALDILLPYLIARAFIRDLDDLRRLLVVIAPGVLLVGLSMLAEALSGEHLVRPLFAQWFGPLASYEAGNATGTLALTSDYRLGFLRAYGPFNHPIHAGLFMACMLPLFASSGLRGWPLYAGVFATLLAFFSGSTAAYLTFILALALLAYDRLREHVNLLNWQLPILASAIALLGLELLSKSGAVAVLGRFTLNPATTSFRQLIWEHGTQSVAQHPLFGIAFDEYQRLNWMGASIDNYWLLLAVRHGLVVPLAFLLLTAVLLIRLSRRPSDLALVDRRFETGLFITLFVLVAMGFTVAFSGSVLCLFFLLLGAVGSLVQQRR